jgi:hypothetical protein
VKDVVFGQCAPACAGGGAPVAGICAGGATKPTDQPSGACAKGQVPDFVSGKCANQCPSGQPPLEGMCFP